MRLSGALVQGALGMLGKVLIRADSSADIGIGHIMRCLTLADELRDGGVETGFICRDMEGDATQYIASKGYPVHQIKNLVGQDKDAAASIAVLDACAVDWLVVDHYDLDIRWERQLRERVRKIMVVDDLANRSHDCDLLLDQNYFKNQETRYEGFLPAGCQQFIGPTHVLLRPEFREAAKHARKRDGSVKRVLISMGGSDPENVTSMAINAVASLDANLAIDVVVGISNPYKHEVEKMCAAIPYASYHCQTDTMASLIQKADLGIGAGGATTWERGFLGLPTLTIACAENQLQTTLDIAEKEATLFLGCAEDIKADDIASAVSKAINSPQQLARMGKRIKGLLGEITCCDKSASAEVILSGLRKDSCNNFKKVSY